MILDIKTIQSKLGDVKKLVVAEHTDQGHFYRHLPTGGLFASVTTKTSVLGGDEHLKVWAAKLAVERLTYRLRENPSALTDTVTIDTYQKESILVHKDQFEDAGGIGTIGHKYIETYLGDWISTGEKPLKPITSYIKEGEDVRAWAITRSAELFIKDFHAIPIASEFFVASVKHKYAGTLDGLMMVIITKEKCAKESHTFFHRSTTNPLKMQCVHCGLKENYKFALTDWKTSNQIDKLQYAMQVSAYWEALREMTGLKPKKLLIIRLDKKQAKYDVMEVVNHHKAFSAFKHVSGVYDWIHNDEKKMVPLLQKEIVKII